MKKFLNYISIALVTLTLFSCNKNEWTPEKEADFKKQFTETAKTKGNGMFSDEQATYIADCVFDKIKADNLKPNDIKKPGVVMSVRQMGAKCSQEALSKFKSNTAINNNWTAETEKTYKSVLKRSFMQNGVMSDKAEFLANCALTKMKEQNIGPADLQDPKKSKIAREIGIQCGQELMKKK
ncbi:hypothetical protein [Flavobacterium ginsenosidimutans]|uniref:Lipoprotein n=1 Tax=Flavobacterium ginsenosidimutans TaxID=687844 RepID=A0ABZ2QC31_9FLAO|nr:hypothetical protein [Flavobacterium ginsenosidimutans]KAF2332241.1 hypothetical protein DM444_09770 [Flavobacterium ginsenosidimutans]